MAQETQGLCINLEGCMAQEKQELCVKLEGDGREFQKGGDTCIPVADSCWGLTENSKIL